MQEVKGDLWDYPADIRCITTNGFVKQNGACVMGRGCAKEARDKFPGIDKALGRAILTVGNHVNLLLEYGNIVSFPVKHTWNQQADPELIKRSAEELLILTNAYGWDTVVIPRPGCGNGGLKWENLKPLLEPILDDRFHIITF